MPTYDYRCESCGHRFDVWQKMSDDPITVCPKCAGHVRRVIHPAGIVFKGAGFYITETRGASATADGASTPDKLATPTPSGESSDSTAQAKTPAASAAASGTSGAKAAS